MKDGLLRFAQLAQRHCNRLPSLVLIFLVAGNIRHDMHVGIAFDIFAITLPQSHAHVLYAAQTHTKNHTLAALLNKSV